MGERLRVGVVGCGLIAQVKHLPLLSELHDRYEVAAVCDLSPEVVDACQRRHRVPRGFTRWQELLAAPLDAVWVLTGGSHAPIAAAAARAGRHVFVEKPLCLSSAEGRELVAEVEASGVTAMVGYMKRHDPAYQALAEALARFGDLRLVRATILEAPLRPYVAHRELVSGELPPALLAELRADDRERVRRAIGEVDEPVWRTYRSVLLESLVHDLNALRGLLGEPDELVHAEIHGHGVVASLRFGATPCVLTWTDLPDLARYEQEYAFYGSGERAGLRFGSPFLRDQPARLWFEGGDPGTVRSWRRDEVVSYEDPFKLELVAFHEAVRSGRPPPTTVADALRDVELCERIVAAHLARRADAPAPVGGASP
jgi:predicted dehydrogenase